MLKLLKSVCVCVFEHKENPPQALQLGIADTEFWVLAGRAQKRSFPVNINKFEHYCGAWIPQPLLSGGLGIPQKTRFVIVYRNITSLPGFMIINRHLASGL